MLKTTRWYDDPQFWDTMKPLTFSEQTVVDGEREVDLLGETLRREFGVRLEACRVLDMPCGVGRHAVPLALAGAQVTGLDVHAPFVEQAREAACDAGVEIEWVVGDMYEASFAAPFDVGINLYTSFGYTDDDTADLRLFRVFYNSLAPGGVVVFDTLSTEVLAASYEPVRYVEAPVGVAQWRAVVSDEWRRMNVEVRLFSDGETREAHFSHRIYSAGELRWMLRDAGFEGIRVLGSLSGKPFAPGARRCVVLARRPH